jgi:hypothetical protein
MFEIVKPKTPWSKIGIRVLIGAFAASILLALLEGCFRGPLINGHDGNMEMLYIWVADFRYLAGQIIYAATIFTVGAKFIETRTIFSVGFDKLDADKISCKGPDENNIVWIGRRYGTKMEAETVAQVFASRLKESAA